MSDNNITNAQKCPVNKFYGQFLTIQDIADLIDKSYQQKRSWRGVGQEFGIYPNMARMIANGYKPGAKVRATLGLPPVSSVMVMSGEPLPDGTQVFTARRCSCGRWFVQNSPARKRCFLCSPARLRHATR